MYFVSGFKVPVDKSSQKILSYSNVTKLMKLLKQLTIAFAITFSMASFSPVFAAGKIENATNAQVKAAADNALASAEAALAGIKDGSHEEVIMQHLNNAAQETKKIEVGTTLDPKRSKAVANIKVARKAVQDKDNAKATEALTKAVELYKELKNAL